MVGYVKSYRSMDEHPLLQDPVSLMVWSKILWRAAYKPTRVRWRGQLVTLQPGEMIVSVREFATRCSSTHKQLRRILDEFVVDGMITVSPLMSEKGGTTQGTIGTRISVTNWGTYQGDEAKEGTTQDTVGAQLGHTEQEYREVREPLVLPKDPPERRMSRPQEDLQIIWDAFSQRSRDRSGKRQLGDALRKLPREITTEQILQGVAAYRQRNPDEQFHKGAHRVIRDGTFQDLDAEPPRSNGHDRRQPQSIAERTLQQLHESLALAERAGGEGEPDHEDAPRLAFDDD